MLTIEINFSDKLKRYIDDARKHEIRVLPPDINNSEKVFSVEDEKTIRFGLLGIKGLGIAALENILEVRKQGPFTSMRDFCKRVDLQKVNRRVMEALVKSGAFDFMEITRAKLFAMVETTLTHANYIRDKGFTNQSSLFDNTESDPDLDQQLAKTLDVSWDTLTLAGFERDHLGCYLTVHPFDQYDDIRKKLGIRSVAECLDLPPRRDIRLFGILVKMKKTMTKSKDTRLLLTCEDRSGIFEVTCFFDNPTEHDKPVFEIGQLYMFRGRTDSVFQRRVRITLHQPDQVQRLDEHLADGHRFSVQFLIQQDPQTASLGRVVKSLQKLLERHRGVSPCSVKVWSASDGEIFLRLPNHCVRITPKFIDESKTLLGQESVKIQYVRK